MREINNTNNPKSQYFHETGYFSSLIIDKVDRSLKKSKSHQVSYGFFIIEIINFAELLLINNEEVLTALTNELINHINKIEVDMIVDLIHRDQLLVIIPNCFDFERLDSIANILYDEIHNFGFSKKKVSIYFHPVLGGTINNIQQEFNPQEILNQCFIALKIAEANDNKFFCSYRDALTSQGRLNEEIQLANYLHRAIENNKLQLAYQPIICAKTGDISYYECLLRLMNEADQLISVGPFINTAEKFSFVHLIDETVMALVSTELINNPILTLSFNLSAVCFDNKKILNLINGIIKHYPEIAKRMIVEITETSLLHDLKRAADFTNELQKYGCKVALDDFGAGYTSFKQLKMLAVDIVKIDGIFIRDIINNKENRVFVKVLLEICQEFGLKSVAEFVENAETARILVDMGVDAMQGNYFSPALNFKPWAQYSC